MQTQQGVDRGNLKAYLITYLLSLAFIFGAFYFNTRPLFITAFGLVQAWIQLYTFLNLGKETKPRWNLMAFLFTLMVTFILVVGSIWIMYNLNYNLMGHD